MGSNATVADVKAFVQAREGEWRRLERSHTGQQRSDIFWRLLPADCASFREPGLPKLHDSIWPPAPAGCCTGPLATWGLIRAYHRALLLAGVAPEDVYVVFNGKPLEEAALLSAAGVEEAATLEVLGRLLGGAKKRKKKTYTKPKKQKHKHKKIKLRVLKFYKVDDSGKVQRLRKQCPQCGPGTFMATHFDRVYCGKCTTTYLVEAEKGGKGKAKK